MVGFVRSVAVLVTAALVLLSSGRATADETKLGPADYLYLTDGKGHYIAVSAKSPSVIYYARGKESFHKQRILSQSRDTIKADKPVRISFWAPNAQPTATSRRMVSENGTVARKAGRWTLRCGTRTMPLFLAGDGARAKLVARAFKPRLHKRRLHLIARDDDGTYYLVDRAAIHVGREDFRLYKGESGAMRRLPITEVILDEVGEIYRSGQGKLVRNNVKRTLNWRPRGNRDRPVELFELRLRENSFLVYGTLGVYRSRLGTPCDDL